MIVDLVGKVYKGGGLAAGDFFKLIISWVFFKAVFLFLLTFSFRSLSTITVDEERL